MSTLRYLHGRTRVLLEYRSRWQAVLEPEAELTTIRGRGLVTKHSMELPKHVLAGSLAAIWEIIHGKAVI